MKTGGKKFRKRPYHIPGDKTPFSASLRQIGEHIHQWNVAAGLSQANQVLAGSDMTEHKRSRVLALVADSEFKRGRYAEAARIQLGAATQSVDHATLWLRTHIGHVRALLKVPDVPRARMMALHAVSMSEAKMAEFDEQVRLAGQAVSENGAAVVPAVPHRVSVVATRMGYLFLQEGEPEAAAEFFRMAIQSTKGGANRARQGLARIALAQGDFGRAHRVAADAILRGGFKAKTHSAWITLIAARRQLPGWRISDRLIKGLDSAPAALRARTILTIVRELRKSDMRQWREIAERWSTREGARFPIIEAELRKLFLSSAKAEPGDAAGKREQAEALLRTPELSPQEWLSAAKEMVRASLWEGRGIHVEQLVATARTQYGADFARKARHSLALSCGMAKRSDLARALLRANIRQLASDASQWGKSVWALAKVESSMGNHAIAAALYRQFADESSIPVQFRLQAQLLWAEELVQAGQPGAILAAKPRMTRLLNTVQDPAILLNFARQLSVASPEVADWSEELFDRGVSLATRQFDAAAHPSEAIDILFKLARRQVCDFDRAADAIRQWESLGAEKKEWLWSLRTSFWEYLGLIVRAYSMEGRGEQMETFALGWLDDPATPPIGRVLVGIPYGRHLVNHGRMADALSWFDRLVGEAPTHPLCAIAWYWKALEAHKRGDVAERTRCAECLRLATGMNGGDPGSGTWAARPFCSGPTSRSAKWIPRPRHIRWLIMRPC
jgi:tetratricopeptide (TPR) repeat protein